MTALAGELPASSVEANVGDLDPVHDADGAPQLDRAPNEVARQIEALRRWMALKNIEQVPAYRTLVSAALDEAGASLRLGPRLIAREGYIFLSSGHSVTPAHADHEHNFLLQVRGTKTVTIGTFPDAESERRVMEGMHAGRYGRTGFPPHHPEVFHLEPGTGVYIPPRAVHMVENGDALSISLSLVFHTPELERAARVYALNAKLRRFGLRPRPPRSSDSIDRLKSATVVAWRRLRQVN